VEDINVLDWSAKIFIAKSNMHTDYIVLSSNDQVKIITKEQIGSGANGCVYKAKFFGEDAAAKELWTLTKPDTYALDEEGIREEQTRFLGEVHRQWKFRHTNLVSLRALYVDAQNQKPLYLISEYVPGGSLAQLLKKNPSGLPRNEILQYSRDILSGLSYLHEQHKMIHRDLKPANILIASNGTCKICDFGLTTLAENAKTLVGSPQYVAPEIVQGNYSCMVDIWSFGVVVIEMILGKVSNTHAAICRVEGKSASAKMPEMEVVICRSLVLDPETRLTASELLLKVSDLTIAVVSTEVPKPSLSTSPILLPAHTKQQSIQSEKHLYGNFITLGVGFVIGVLGVLFWKGQPLFNINRNVTEITHIHTTPNSSM